MEENLISNIISEEMKNLDKFLGVHSFSYEVAAKCLLFFIV